MYLCCTYNDVPLVIFHKNIPGNITLSLALFLKKIYFYEYDNVDN